jgi:hypothetical protein
MDPKLNSNFKATVNAMSIPKPTVPRISSDILTNMIEKPHDVQTLIEHIRLTRIKLGSVLERLENFEPGQDALGELRDYAERVAIETQLLSETLRRMMGA